MLLLKELKEFKDRLLKESNKKQLFFFQYLSKVPLELPPEDDLSDIEQICLAVFSNDAQSKKHLIARKRNEHVKKDIRYYNNLIEIAAMATDDFEKERDGLKSYIQKHSTRDFFILNYLFKDISRDPPKPIGSIDHIAFHLYEGSFPEEDWKQLLLNGLYETTDLIDFYVVEQGFLQAMDDHPVVQRVNEIAHVTSSCEKFVEKTERNIKWTIRAIILLIVLPTTYWFGTFIYNNWELAERIIVIIELSLFLGAFLVVALFGFFQNKVKMVNLLWEKILNWVFRVKGLNRLKLKELINKLR